MTTAQILTADWAAAVFCWAAAIYAVLMKRSRLRYQARTIKAQRETITYHVDTIESLKSYTSSLEGHLARKTELLRLQVQLLELDDDGQGDHEERTPELDPDLDREEQP